MTLLNDDRGLRMIFLLAVGALAFALLGWVTNSPPEILIEWSTASELDTIGYHIYRSDAAEEPFTRINPSLIPASTDPQAGGDYTYRDADVIPGVVYFYQLEAISQDGTVERHGPILAEAQAAFPIAWILSAIFALSTLVFTILRIKSRR